MSWLSKNKDYQSVATLGLSDVWGALGGGGQDQSISQVGTLDLGQQSIWAALAPWLAGRVGQGATPYEGQLTAGMQPAQQNAMSLLGQFMGQGYQTPMASQMATSLQQMSDPTAMAQRYQQAAMPVAQQAMAQMMPQMKEEFVGTGTRLSQGLVDRGGQLAQNLSQQVAAGAQQAAQQGMQTAASLYPAVLGAEQAQMQYPWQQAQAGMQMGEMARQIEQQQLTAQFQEFLRTQPENAPLLQAMLQALGLQTQQTVVDPGQESFLASLLQGMAPGVGMGLGAALGSRPNMTYAGGNVSSTAMPQV